MPIVFTEEQRKTITRRRLNIITENENYAATQNVFEDQKLKFLQVDQSNDVFHQFFYNICQKYETEYRQINGQVADTYTSTDVTNAAAQDNDPIFFPNSPTFYIRAIPLIDDPPFTNNKVRGIFFPVSTDVSREQNIIVNATFTSSLQDLLNLLQNGISAGTPATTTSSSTVAPGLGSFTLNTAVTTGFSVGDSVFLSDSTGSGYYTITNIVPSTSITVNAIYPTAIGMTNPSLDNDYVFTVSERQNLTSSLYQELLTNLTNSIFSRVNDWLSKVNAQLVNLNANEETRSSYKTLNVNAKTNAQNTDNDINTWLAYPNTGVTGKYISANIAPLISRVASRISYLPTRITQIQSAFAGSASNALSQSGDSFTSTDITNMYYERYKWLNIRINRISGSLKRYYNVDKAKNSVSGLTNDNNAAATGYDQFFLVKKLSFIDTTDTVHVTNNSGLSVGDQVYIISETQPEIKRAVKQLLGTTQIKLDSPVPNTYTTQDLMRLYKLLG